MSPAFHATALGLISFGVPVAVAIYDLFTLRRGPDWLPDPPPDPAPVSPPPWGGATRPLPDCLIPKLPPARTPASVRELVDA